MADPHSRLSQLMQARRLELGMKTWRALATEAGISSETLRALRTGENVAPGTADALEKALQWAPGSIARILEGGEPRGPSGRHDADPSQANAGNPELRDEVEVELWGLSLPEDDRRQYIAIYRARKEMRRQAQ